MLGFYIMLLDNLNVHLKFPATAFLREMLKVHKKTTYRNENINFWNIGQKVANSVS